MTRDFWVHPDWIQMQKIIKTDDSIKVMNQINKLLKLNSDTSLIYGLTYIQAVKNNNLQMMIFLEKESLINNIAFSKDIPFQVACTNGNIEILNHFITKGYSFVEGNYGDINYLFYIFDVRNFKISKWALQNSNENINQKDREQNRTLLVTSVLSHKNTVKKVKLLLQYGADKNITDIFNKRPYDYVNQFIKNPLKKKKLQKLLK